jgi:AcrR family transcriptional regulator
VRPAQPVRERVIDGALRCIASRGAAGTTLDDVARRAGCSRATVYRAFPGGRDAVLAAVVDADVRRFFNAVAVHMEAPEELEDVLVAGMVCAATELLGHHALSYLRDHEPELVLAPLAFARLDEVLALSCAHTAPLLSRFLDPKESTRVAEWAARIVVSYLVCPAEGFDLTDESDVRRLVQTFVLPGVAAMPTDKRISASRGVAPRSRSRSTQTRTTPLQSTPKGEAS